MSQRRHGVIMIALYLAVIVFGVQCLADWPWLLAIQSALAGAGIGARLIMLRV